MNEVLNNSYGFPIPDEHIPSDDDMIRLHDGDETVVPVLINGLTGFIVNEMEWFLHKTPVFLCYKEDIIAEALLGLTEFVNKSVGRQYSPGKFVGYSKKHCLNAVNEWLVKTQLPVSVPRGSLFGSNQAKLNVIQSREVKEEDKQTTPDGLFSEVWFDDFMESLNERDQTIMRMKLNGASNAKIGRALNLEPGHVRQRAARLLTRYAGEDDA